MKNKEKTKKLKDTFAGALEYFRKKDFKSAEKICYKVLSIDVNNFDCLSLLATINAFNKDFKKAKELLHKAVEINQKNTSALHNLATAYKELGNLDDATTYYKKVLLIDEKHVNANYNLGSLFYNSKNFKEAKKYFLKTVEIQSNFALAFFSLGNVNVDLKEYNNAISNYQKAIEINPQLVGAYNNLGLVFRIFNDFPNAIKSYKEAIKIQPEHAGAYHNLALAHKEIGQFENAIKYHETAIKYEPENASHYYYLSDLKKEIIDSNLKEKIEKIVTNKNSKNFNKAYGYFLLSKYEKKEKNYKNELEYLIKGHKNYFESKKEKFKLGVKYCFEDVLQIVEGVKVNNIKEKDNYEVKPIFIIGVPRCGSTLIEKIITSGKETIPAGEETAVLENFVNEKILEKKSLNLGETQELRNELYEIYKNKGVISKKHNFTFTDKSLNNFFYLEIIKSIYPKAKIINCNRNALSSIVSIFQNNLTELAWAHDLENIFKYFDNYFTLVNNFDKSNPGLIYQLNFSKLINDPENESKKIMEYCELPWDKKCLEFYKRTDLISKTASNVQIRKAIYKHSSDKYVSYKKLLDKYGQKYSWFD